MTLSLPPTGKRGRPSGHMTPLRESIARYITAQRARGGPVLVSTVARYAEIDRRSARRIIADLKAMQAI
jgi:nicotinamidase-related amidase